MEKLRFPSAQVNIEVTTTGKGRDCLHQKLTFPDGEVKKTRVDIRSLCDEGEELLDDLSKRNNPVFKGTQQQWYSYLNLLLASRGQSFDFPNS